MNKTEANRDFILNKLMKQVEDFPTLPTIYTELVKVTENPNHTLDDITHVLSSDQAVATKLLKLSNSALYGHSKRVSSVKEAVFIIGTREIRALVLTMSVMRLFEGAQKNENFDPKNFWEYSFAVGSISRAIAKELKQKNYEDIFVAGIIHGIGKLFLLVGLPDLYPNIISVARIKKMELKEVEKLVLGISHSVVAKLLVEKWNLPRDYVILFDNLYSGLFNGNFHQFATTVHISMVASSMLRIGDSADEIVPKLNKDVWEKININSKFFSNNLEKVKKEVLELKMLLCS